MVPIVADASGTFFALIPLAIGIAVLRHRLYDLNRLVSRTVSYALVTGLLAVVYVGLLTAAGRLASDDNPIALAASTLAVAALFQPVRRRVQRLVNRQPGALQRRPHRRGPQRPAAGRDRCRPAGSRTRPGRPRHHAAGDRGRVPTPAGRGAPVSGQRVALRYRLLADGIAATSLLLVATALLAGRIAYPNMAIGRALYDSTFVFGFGAAGWLAARQRLRRRTRGRRWR
ncbi:MAG: hypothetical protein ABJA34_13225 [Pseudonocardiales bacterium]